MDIKTLTPQAKFEAVNSIIPHPGWQLYCARFDEVMAKQVDAKIFDPTVPAEEREALVRARKFLVENCTPENMRAGMVRTFQSEHEKLQARIGK